jgi:porin
MFHILPLLVCAGLVVAAPAHGWSPLDLPEQGLATAPDIEGSVDSEPTPEDDRNSWLKRDQLLGDVGGLRPLLERYGMTFELNSYDEGFSSPNVRLENETGREYHGLTDLVLTLDTESARWWNGGRFVITLQNTRGGDISNIVGDAQGISNIVAPPGTRFAEYHLVQETAGGRLVFKVGKQDANADFVVSDGGGEFINSSFGLIPTVPLPTFPAPAMGAMGSWQPTDFLKIKAGYWDGAPIVGSGSFGTAFDGSGGNVSALGVEITPFGGSLLDGTFRIGVWHHSEVEVVEELKDTRRTSLGAADGLYFTADQGLWEDDVRRLAVFAQGGWGRADRSAFANYFGGGLTFSAPFTRRPNDVVGIGVAWAEIGDIERASPDSTSETVIELFYKLPITPWMTLNPDIQWVDRPSGLDGGAFVAGLRVATVF